MTADKLADLPAWAIAIIGTALDTLLFFTARATTITIIIILAIGSFDAAPLITDARPRTLKVILTRVAALAARADARAKTVYVRQTERRLITDASRIIALLVPGTWFLAATRNTFIVYAEFIGTTVITITTPSDPATMSVFFAEKTVVALLIVEARGLTASQFADSVSNTVDITGTLHRFLALAAVHVTFLVPRAATWLTDISALTTTTDPTLIAVFGE